MRIRDYTRHFPLQLPLTSLVETRCDGPNQAECTPHSSLSGMAEGSSLSKEPRKFCICDCHMTPSLRKLLLQANPVVHWRCCGMHKLPAAPRAPGSCESPAC